MDEEKEEENEGLDLTPIKLRKPVSWGKEKLAEFVFNEPTAKHLRGMSAAPSMSEMLDFAGRIAGWTPRQMDGLGLHDTAEILKRVGEFMPTDP